MSSHGEWKGLDDQVLTRRSSATQPFSAASFTELYTSLHYKNNITRTKSSTSLSDGNT